MSATTTATSDTPSQGTDVASAASNIADILARDSGDPESQAERQPQAKADNAKAQQSEDEGTTPIAEEAADEGAEPEIEPEDEGTDEPEEEAAEALPEDALVTVEIDGKSQQLPLGEVTKGYLRQADYTRKTQALADERKAFEGETTAMRQERQQYAQLLPALAYQIKQMMGTEPDWERLKAEDPMGYMLQREEWREGQSRIAAAKQEYERVRAAELAEAGTKTEALIRQETEKLVEALPAWKDSNRRKADMGRLREYGHGLGWSDDELDAVTDHRALVVLYKAMKYDEALKRRPTPEPQRTRAPAPQPGAPRPVPSRQVTDLTRDKQRLAKTHSLRDAKSVIERLLT